MSQVSSFNPPSGSVEVYTLTGNSGGAVSPSGHNINVLGDGTSINVVGVPGAHSLLINVVANRYVESLTADVGGIALPTAGNIDILGGTNVTTVRAGSTITINAAGASSPVYTNVNASPYTVLAGDNFLSVDTSGIPITIRLPNAPVGIQSWIIKDRSGNAAANNITVTTVGGVVLIDGNAIYTMNTNYEAINVLWNGASYEVF